MGDVTSFASEKAKKSGDCRDWSVLDCLKETVRQIEAGEKKAPDMVFIAMRIRAEDEGADKIRYDHMVAGMTQIETLGLLSKHLLIVERDD